MTQTLGGCESRRGRLRFWWLAAAIAAILAASFQVQLPTIADWSNFAFWDPGSELKANWLLTLGFKPGIDFGYTHGLASLAVTRCGFALFGQTPAAYLIQTLVMELLMAIALARLAIAFELNRPATVFLLVALPVAIVPRYPTLTHPLQALLLLWALAAQAEGRRPWALALCAAGVFVQPSMAYVYGFILLLWTLRAWWLENGTHGHGDTWSRRVIGPRSLRALWQRTWPALATAVLMAVLLAWRFGLRSLALTVVPLAGSQTYRDYGFGFFSHGLTQFLFPAPYPPYYPLITPAGLWLAMTLLVVAGMVITASVICRRNPPADGPAQGVALWSRLDHHGETFLSIGAMHLLFVLGFYGWRDSWQSYSFLPVLFTAVMLSNMGLLNSVQAGKSGHEKPAVRSGFILASSFCFLAVLSQEYNLLQAAAGWKHKMRTPQTGYLWVYKDQLAQWRQALTLTRHQPVLALVFGLPPWLPRGMTLPLSWYPVAGIPTSRETARLKHEIISSPYVLVWRPFQPHDPWHSAGYAAIRKKFSRLSPRRWKYFSVWRKMHP